MVKLTLNLDMYPQQAILNACYSFLDQVYIYLSYDESKENIIASLKPKEECTPEQFEQIKGAFTNELIHSVLRLQISKKNEKLREYIVGRALYSMVPVNDLFPETEEADYQDDPLGIAKPWEEKYGQQQS